MLLHEEYKNLLLENATLNRVKIFGYRYKYIKQRLLEIERHWLSGRKIVELTREVFGNAKLID